MTTQPTQEAPSSDVLNKVLQVAREELNNLGADPLDVEQAWTRLNLAALASTAGDTLKAENERIAELEAALEDMRPAAGVLNAQELVGFTLAKHMAVGIARTALGSDQ